MSRSLLTVTYSQIHAHNKYYDISLNRIVAFFASYATKQSQFSGENSLCKQNINISGKKNCQTSMLNRRKFCLLCIHTSVCAKVSFEYSFKLLLFFSLSFCASSSDTPVFFTCILYFYLNFQTQYALQLKLLERMHS